MSCGKKQISLFVPLADWKLLRDLAAARNRPMTEILLEHISFRKIEQQLAKARRRRADHEG